MVRIADLHPAGRKTAEELDCPVFDDHPFNEPPAPDERRVALISSAALITRGSAPFRRGDPGYRTFSSEVDNNDLLISHISINFDRSAAYADIETIFPRKTLKELQTTGAFGAVADNHYSFMGSTDPLTMEEEAIALVRELNEQSVNTAVFLPV